jgi:hypothetical protein
MDKKQTLNEVLEHRFIERVLRDTAKDIDKAQIQYMQSRGFASNDWFAGRNFAVANDNLQIQVLKKHRFVDMKTRTSKKGTKRKKAHPVYNRIIYGHYNNIIRELSFGFTDAIKEQLKTLND